MISATQNSIHKKIQTERKEQISFNGLAKPVEYVVKKTQIPVIQPIACAGNLTAGIAFLIGGPALIYEFIHRKFNKTQPSIKPTPVLRPIRAKKNEFFQINKTRQEDLIKQLLSKQNMNSKVPLNNGKAIAFKGGGGGVDTLNPQTEIGKFGLKAAKIGTATAGGAGLVNGIAMKLPVLAAGEGITTLSAPIVETPVGLAVFGLGLGAINLARVLDSDPKFKIDPIKFSAMKFGDQVGYIAKNVKDTCVELVKSTRTVGKNFAGLLGKNTKQSWNFIKTHMLSTNPIQLLIKELITKDGKVTVQKSMKASPYLMHFATLVLTAGAGSIILFNKTKQPKAEKAGLRMYNVGNGIDNIALTKWGAEKFKASASPAYKTSGVFSSIAGLSILTSQGGLDKDWGRGLFWTAVGLILTGFAFERGADIRKIWKNRHVQQEVTSQMRQWRIDLDRFFTPKQLKDKIIVNGKKKTRLKSIIDAINGGGETRLNKALDRVKAGIKNGETDHKQAVPEIDKILRRNLESKQDKELRESLIKLKGNITGNATNKEIEESIGAVQGNLSKLPDEDLNRVVETIEGVLGKSKTCDYRECNLKEGDENSILKEIRDAVEDKYKDCIQHEGTFGEAKKVTDFLKKQSEKIFGKNPELAK